MSHRCGQRMGLESGITVQLFLSLYENRSSQSKDSFAFFTSLHFFFLFLHYLQSHSISLIAHPCFFASQGVLVIIFFFYTICYHHLSSSVLNIVQSIQSFPKVSQQILPILPHCHVFPSGSALPHSQRVWEMPSFLHSLILPVLPAIVFCGTVQ